MKRVLGALVLLVLLVGCGEAEVQTYSKDGVTLEPWTPPPTTIDPAAAAKKDACDKLLRTWAVKAKGLSTTFSLGLSEGASEVLDEMTGATDQMEIEQCPDSEARSDALKGNYEAAVTNAAVTACAGDLDCSLDAAERWGKKGAPLVGKVMGYSGISAN